MSEGTGADGSSVPVELRGREASARLLTPFFEAARRNGVPPEVLARETGYTVEHLQNRRERIAWSSYMTLLENLGREFDDHELVAIGAAQLDNPIHRAMLLPGRLLFTLPEIYRWGVRPDGPLAQHLVVQDMSVTRIGDRRLRFDAKMKPGYTCVREFWLLRLGFLQSVPRAFGLPPAAATLSSSSADGACYEINLPEETTLAGRVRERASWLFAARDVAAELRSANDDLHERYLELQREVESRRDAEQRLHALNTELEERVASRTKELERANRDLAAANTELTLFSASVAHDLRAPLRAINGFATAVIEDHGDKLDPDAKRQLDRVIASAVRMGALVDALLALSRVSRVEIKRERVDLGGVARGVIEDLRAAEPKREVEITIGPELDVEGDPALVRSLTENLLANAWKFTREREPARIELTRSETSPAVFCVRDNGVGFDMQRAGVLFSPFRRLHSSSEFEGVGIGLAIVERIVRRHGGKIWADATPGSGAAFWFTLTS